ncbi:MAG: hypothetical protein FD126_790 [Elusimicrobia bacterium]|nr:MAG: hypothetical protein FD126_790 [Elusimicrobiota bacterium]
MNSRQLLAVLLSVAVSAAVPKAAQCAAVVAVRLSAPAGAAFALGAAAVPFSARALVAPTLPGGVWPVTSATPLPLPISPSVRAVVPRTPLILPKGAERAAPSRPQTLPEDDLLREIGATPEPVEPAKESWSERLSVMAAALPADSRHSPIDAAGDWGRFFDLSARRSAVDRVVFNPASPSRQGPKLEALRDPVGGRNAVTAPPPGQERDELGGPRRLRLSAFEQLSFGLKSGLVMVGAAAAFNLAASWLGSLLSLAAGEKSVQDFAGSGIVDAPWTFLFPRLAAVVSLEEVVFRAFLFGALLIVLARLPGSARKWAFPAAAALSALAFAAAHITGWGFSWPGLLVRAGLGYFLSWVYRRTGNLVAPIAAHWFFDAAQYFGLALALSFGLPGLAAEYFLFLQAFGLAAFLLAPRFLSGPKRSHEPRRLLDR